PLEQYVAAQEEAFLRSDPDPGVAVLVNLAARRHIGQERTLVVVLLEVADTQPIDDAAADAPECIGQWVHELRIDLGHPHQASLSAPFDTIRTQTTLRDLCEPTCSREERRHVDLGIAGIDQEPPLPTPLFRPSDQRSLLFCRDDRIRDE